MSRPAADSPLFSALFRALIAALFAVSCALMALSALLPGQALLPAVLYCLVFSAAFSLLFSVRLRFKWLLPLLCTLAIGIWGILGGGPLHTLLQLVKAGYLSVCGIPDAIAPYADAARLSLCLLFSLLAAAILWDEMLAIAIFALSTVACLSFVLGGSEQVLFFALPGVLSILLLASPRESRRPIALPVAAALTALALLFTPAHPQTVPEMEKAAEEVRNLVEDYLLFNESRTSFSLRATGWQPLENRLGGEANPSHGPVMEVQTTEKLLLRGKSYDTYTGLNWQDSLSTRRYLYISPRFETLRNETFDYMRPLSGADSLPLREISIHLLAPGTTTLFAPQRLRAFEAESERMVLYYNTAAELFITRETEAGDRYTVSYLPLSPESKQTEQCISACAELPDAHYSEVEAQYTKLPGHLQKEIRELALRITAKAETPYEKALAIERYLQTHYRYTLDVKDPPADVDFVAWFLLGEQKGYCTYFASAMTVLCRLVGVPARYTTGFLALPDENGLAYVTGEQAHAWTEVYLSGFGWLAFDPTPRTDNRRDPDANGGDEGEDGDEEPPPPSTPTPEPTLTPTPTPSPEDTSPDTPPTPTPEPTQSPSPQDAPTASPPPALMQNEQEQDRSLFLLFFLLALLLLFALCILRFRLTEPCRRAARHPEQAVSVYLSALCAYLSLLGVRRAPAETWQEFGLRAEEALPGFADLAARYSALLYGKKPVDPAAFAACYLRTRDAAPRLLRARLAVKRMLGKNSSK